MQVDGSDGQGSSVRGLRRDLRHVWAAATRHIHTRPRAWSHTQTRSTTLPAACSSEHTGRDSTRRVCIGTDHHRAEHTDDALNANLSAGTMLADCAEAIQLFMIPLYRGSRSYSD